ncbi:myotubularin-related protein 8-like isoform X2 [Dysidea avara]|uniref:myotubularin-related protein 8-like isoform X2 n=1 Tax=Dysidea avara TaxID=196820 RepID=UPI00332E554E
MDDRGKMNLIKTPKVEKVLLRQNNKIRTYTTGTLCLTPAYLIFIEPTGAKETWVLYHHISSVERLPLTTKGYPLVVKCYTFLVLHLIFPRESECVDVVDTVKMLSHPERYNELCAFHPPSHWEQPMHSGWVMYDAMGEYVRMGVPNEYWGVSSLNELYKLCDSYPRFLCFPKNATDDVITGSAKFRSKHRLPALSYYYKANSSAICRSAQPLAGVSKRSQEDEMMIQAILQANPNSSFMYIMDTRPKLNAMANRAAGKGYENTGFYNNVTYQFIGIQNIHIMRESLQKLVEVTSPQQLSMSQFLTGLEGSGWFKHIRSILLTSLHIVKAVVDENTSVLVHCSDGWDRTAQTCSLATLMIDPFYRTLHGFMILIEKEWLSFGHKFSHRCGHLNTEPRDVSPVFGQFIECVWQMKNQFPTAFEFNDDFLLTLHDHAYSCQYGTFLGNNEKERLEMNLQSTTYSLWGLIWQRLNDYINPLYDEMSHQDVIKVSVDFKQLRYWTGLYNRFNEAAHPRELVEEKVSCVTQQNVCLDSHISHITKQIEVLKMKLSKMDSNEVTHNGWADTSVPDDRELSQDLPSPEQCDGHQLEYNDPLLQPVRGVEFNWEPLRSVSQCQCGSPFSFAYRKYHCSRCGHVLCHNCVDKQVTLPFHANHKPQRCCKSCYKEIRLINKRTT